MKKLVMIAAALGTVAGICASTAGATAPAAASRPSAHSGTLHVTKECSAYTGQADDHCTITSSNLTWIKPGSRVVYLQAAVGTSLDSDIVLVVGPGSYALGHVRVDLATGVGSLRLSGGAGKFRSLHAKAAVTPLGGGSFAWDGRYHVDG
jgi:hypothetical protein